MEMANPLLETFGEREFREVREVQEVQNWNGLDRCRFDPRINFVDSGCSTSQVCKCFAVIILL